LSLLPRWLVRTDLIAAMRRLKEGRGIPVTTQIEKAVKVWLKREYGIVVEKSDRKRARTHKRS
jgi:hypothetical protein